MNNSLYSKTYTLGLQITVTFFLHLSHFTFYTRYSFSHFKGNGTRVELLRRPNKMSFFSLNRRD